MISSPAGRKQSTYNMGGKPKCRQGTEAFQGKRGDFCILYISVGGGGFSARYPKDGKEEITYLTTCGVKKIP